MKLRLRTTSPRPALAAIAAGVAIFAVPSAASAAVAPAVNGNQLTLTSDAAADNITLTANAAGLITHNLGAANGLADATDFNPDPNLTTTLPSDGTVAVTVNGGAGNDTVNLSAANLAPSAINGEDGDDIITGSGAVDAISGGAGNDRITGFRGNETINGDDGNDVMIWNNGDGNDVNEGGNGVDESLITAGTADDDMTVAANGARTVFNRINAPFSVDMGTVEKLTITSFSGNDKLATAAGVTMPMNIDAGSGDDAIVTGDGADVILGGDGNDSLSAAGGGDRIVGDRGGDTMNGGGGDDTLVWNNGDGSDVMNGDDGVDRIEDNLSGAADTSTLKVENGRIRYDRTNPGPFNLSIGSSEVFELNTLGGDDTLSVSPGVNIALDVDGGAGNDTLQGANGNDSLLGGDGNDTLNIRDGANDFARGGPGTDKAIADGPNTDAVAPDVESVDRAPAAQASIAKNAKVKRGVASLKVTCPPGLVRCDGAVALFTTKSVRAGKFKVALQLGRKSFAVEPGKSKTIKIKLGSGTARLAKNKKLTVTARVFTKGAGETSAKLKLRF